MSEYTVAKKVTQGSKQAGITSLWPCAVSARRQLIARNVEELHSAHNNLIQETALDESSRMVNCFAAKSIVK